MKRLYGDAGAGTEQIVIGVVMTDDGISIAHYPFRDNTVDSTTVKPVFENIKKRFGVDSLTIVEYKRHSQYSVSNCLTER